MAKSAKHGGLGLGNGSHQHYLSGRNRCTHCLLSPVQSREFNTVTPNGVGNTTPFNRKTNRRQVLL